MNQQMMKEAASFYFRQDGRIPKHLKGSTLGELKRTIKSFEKQMTQEGIFLDYREGFEDAWLEFNRTIRPMSDEERNRSRKREQANKV